MPILDTQIILKKTLLYFSRSSPLFFTDFWQPRNCFSQCLL